MKFSSPFVLALASFAAARPRYGASEEEGDPLPQKSRVTAFVIDDKGVPHVQCWEFEGLESDVQVSNRAGSNGAAHRVNLARRGELEGLDILTFPPYSPIWPDPDNTLVHAEWMDMSNSNNLFSVQAGLISFELGLYSSGDKATATDEDDDTYASHIFNHENGDDWFYFEDNYSGTEAAAMANAAPAPVQISTKSSSETEVIRLKYTGQPTHRVLHEGGCKFTGIEAATSNAAEKPRLVVNEL